MAALTENERIKLLMIRGWGDRRRSLDEVRTIFNNEFRDEVTAISKSTVSRTISRFENTGEIKDRRRTGRPITAATEEKKMAVAQLFVENPHGSLRKAALEFDTSLATVQRCMNSIKFHPYKINLLHELNEDDPDRRQEFAELMMERINANPMYLYKIVFSDEATFTLHGEVNRHNCRYWADENPHWFRETKSQYPQKLNVWAGLINDTIVGPFFIEGNLNSAKYEEMLRNEIIPAIQAIVGDDFDSTHFQQDGAAAHYGRSVRSYLDEVFPNRWIGRRGPTEWPARSPDLTPLDYFLWGYLKSKVYATKPQNLAELRERIITESQLLDAEIIKRSIKSFADRMSYCQETQGQHFEHLLK